MTAWGELSAALRASEPYRRLAAAAAVRAERLPVPAAAWVSRLLAEDRGRPLLVVAPSESDALSWREAARLFGYEAIHFPAPHLSPYQETEISLGVRAEEAVALAALFDS
ncbi:MAG: hypothetical protein R3325_01650, partial [Thermoanaerobaculia bacterium]|nr:hypothetical protein [Thermoanaerobaculia bacterium]